MNVCTLSGKITRSVNVGEGSTIKFLLRTHYPQRQESGAPSSAIVPCVIFDATETQKAVLLGKDVESVKIELVGKIRQSSYENAQGKKVYSTEVIVEPNGILFQRSK